MVAHSDPCLPEAKFAEDLLSGGAVSQRTEMIVTDEARYFYMPPG